jgi:hypothetical protein
MPRTINIHLTPAELRSAKKRCKKLGITLSQYCLKLATIEIQLDVLGRLFRAQDLTFALRIEMARADELRDNLRKIAGMIAI